MDTALSCGCAPSADAARAGSGARNLGALRMVADTGRCDDGISGAVGTFFGSAQRDATLLNLAWLTRLSAVTE